MKVSRIFTKMLNIKPVAEISKADAFRGLIIGTLNSPTFHKHIGKKPTPVHLECCSYILYRVMDDSEVDKEIVEASKELKILLEKRLDLSDQKVSLGDLMNEDAEMILGVLYTVAEKFHLRCISVCAKKTGLRFDL